MGRILSCIHLILPVILLVIDSVLCIVCVSRSVVVIVLGVVAPIAVGSRRRHHSDIVLGLWLVYIVVRLRHWHWRKGIYSVCLRGLFGSSIGSFDGHYITRGPISSGLRGRLVDKCDWDR